jgi:hypothetical protein
MTPGRGRGRCARDPDPCNTAPEERKFLEFSNSNDGSERRMENMPIGKAAQGSGVRVPTIRYCNR